MSYTRSLESGYYIYPTGETVEFVVSQASVSNEEIDVFLYKLYNKRKTEFFKRVKNGKKIIKKNRIEKEKDKYDRN